MAPVETMSSCNKIQIVFAPLPEDERDIERSAAKEFALRTAEKFRSEMRTTGGDNNCFEVEISHLSEWKKDKLIAPIKPSCSYDECDDDGSIKAKNTTIVFLISCGPDGSVHRSVRKSTKWMKEQETRINSRDKDNEEGVNSYEIPPAKTTGMVALLGHSVCKTSAEQMEDEVFSSGRRLAKSLRNMISTPQSSSSQPTASSKPKFLLETHIELEPPEEKFDGWLESWIEQLQK